VETLYVETFDANLNLLNSIPVWTGDYSTQGSASVGDFVTQASVSSNADGSFKRVKSSRRA
jgi:hypothetical protein